MYKEFWLQTLIEREIKNRDNELGEELRGTDAWEKMPSLLNNRRSINKSNYVKCYHPHPQLHFQECKWLAKHGVSLRLRNWYAFSSSQAGTAFLISTAMQNIQIASWLNSSQFRTYLQETTTQYMHKKTTHNAFAEVCSWRKTRSKAR